MSSPAAAGPRLDPVLLGRLMDEHDRRVDGAFPAAAWTALERAGLTRPGPHADLGDDLAAVRRVSACDVSLGRLLDGHLNAVERLRVQVGGPLAEAELARVASGRLALGVWGADPAAGEGDPARIVTGPEGATLHGTKVFCSGAGGLQRAFVLARSRDDLAAVRLAYVDLTSATTVDREWFAGAGMRGSASHRVVFAGAPVLWVAAEPRALLAQPWFAGDGLRTAAGWAGGADAVVRATLDALCDRPGAGAPEQLTAARLHNAGRTLTLRLEDGLAAIRGGAPDLADTTLLARVAIAAAVREILDLSAEAVGARPFAMGGRLERAHRDLRTYLLQHRLDPPLTGLGARLLDRR